MMFYNQVGHQDSIRQRRNDELNEFYPPPPKLTTFTTDDANEFQADSDQSHSYMVCIKRKSYLTKYLSLYLNNTGDLSHISTLYVVFRIISIDPKTITNLARFA